MSKKLLTAKPLNQIKVTSFYGPRKIGVIGSSTNHKGLDINGSSNALRAAAKGRVIANGWTDARGWFIEVKVTRTKSYLYQHMKKKSRFAVGEKVKSGQKIGIKGATGSTGGPHLHMEIRYRGKPVDPLPYFIASYKSKSIVHTIQPIHSNADTVWILEVKRLQEHLKRMKLYKGAIDGKPEKRTGDGIEAFQKKYHLQRDRTFGPACRAKLHELGYQ